ncbi:DUF6159 family protein [Desulfosediminicola ganghwensis]|uniref:DUF6159 family protein n=1 Tax=Desulfosediminicola ganghwensis TaxID=2569540 RepID=UPI0010ACF88B|nr:DUF6159 family protein [Desulfosediminicola ganghwensis]
MNSKSLLKTSWSVLKRDKEIFLFQIISAFCCVSILSFFILPLFNPSENLVESFLNGTLFDIPDSGETITEKIIHYSKLFLLFSSTYFISMFFNVATVQCAIMRMNKQNPTFFDGISVAFYRLPSVLCWSFLSSTIGFLLQFVEERSNWVGNLMAKFIGLTWTLASWLVLPIMVYEKVGPLTSLKRSAKIIKGTWVVALLEEFTFGLLISVLSSKAIFFPLFALLFGTYKSLIIAAFISILYLAVLWSFFSALLTIFQAALFLTVKNNEIPEVFNSGELARFQVKESST